MSRSASPGHAAEERLRMKLGGMQCSFCVGSVRQALTQIDGVIDAGVSLAHEEALVRYDPARVNAQTLRETVQALGYTVRDPDKVRAFEEEREELRRHRDRLIAAGALVALALGLMLAMLGREAGPWLLGALGVVALAQVFGVGWHIARMAWASLRRRILNQHVLMEAGALGGLAGGAAGFFVGSWPGAHFFGAAAFITAYHIASAYVALLVRRRSSEAIARLMALQPATARVVREDREETVSVGEVRVGDRVRVRPGERIPVDGAVLEGESAVDQSLVTGESVPVDKHPGDAVIAGAINGEGTLLVRVTRVGEESFLSAVVRAVGEARALRPPILQLVDRVLGWFVPGVLIAAAGAALVWTLGAWLIMGSPDWGRAAYATLAVLVMGYPCALGMATPLALIRGGGLAARHGIFIRAGEAFEALKDVRRVVLDKTGTLTRGRPAVVAVTGLDGHDEPEVVRLAAAVERYSEHPLAQAIAAHADERGIPPVTAGDFRAFAGRGARASVDGRTVHVGRPGYLRELGLDIGSLESAAETEHARGRSVVAVARGGEILGLIAIADRLKAGAAEAVATLRAQGIHPVIVSGDAAPAARAVARAVGIDEVRAEVPPDRKAVVVRELQDRGERVAMVGDGINDAPALTQADVGVAIGAGTDIAIESADAVLVGEGLGGLVELFRIGRASYRKTVQNLTLAFAFNGLGVPAAMTGLVHPGLAMVAMAASVTAVLANSFLVRSGVAASSAGGEEAERTVIAVPTLKCSGCADSVRQALREIDAVRDVDVDLDAKRVMVRYAGARVDRDRLCEAITRAGHVCGEDQEVERGAA